MTVLDSSGPVDFLLGAGAATEVGALFSREAMLAAPGLLVTKVVAVLRRHVLRGVVTAERASGAVQDLGDLSLDLYRTMPLRQRAWQLRDSLTASDALFLALAELLAEPLATKDRALAEPAGRLVGTEVMERGAD